MAGSQIESNIAEDEKRLKEIESDLQKANSQLETSRENDSENYGKAEDIYTNNREIYDNYKEKKQNLNNATDKRNNLKAEVDSAKTPKERDEKRKELEEAEKELEKAQKEFEEAEKKFDPKLEGIIDNMVKKDGLENEKANFYTPAAILSRINARRGGTTKGELQAKKNEIIQKLTQLKLSDNSHDNVLTTDESDSIERTADKLINSISHGVLTGEGFSTDAQEKLIKNTLKLNSYDNEIMKSIYKSTSDYETEKAKENKAEVYKLQASYGGDGEKLASLEAAMLADRYRAEGKYKASEHSA